MTISIKNITKTDCFNGEVYIVYTHRIGVFPVTLPHHQRLFFHEGSTDDIFELLEDDITWLSGKGYQFEYVYEEDKKKNTKDSEDNHVIHLLDETTIVVEWNGKKLQITCKNLQIKEL